MMFSFGPYRGHSGNIARQLLLEQAHARVWSKKDLPILAHHTKTELLKRIIGLGAPGLLPRGRPRNANGEWTTRAQIHCSTSLMKDDGSIPDKFRRRDIDCVIRLDVARLFDDSFKIFTSDANVALIPRDVPVEYISHATLLKAPRFKI